MRKYLYPLIAVILAAFISSQKPDGLEHVAKILGFAGLAKDNNALLNGYQIPFLGNTHISNALAGIIGLIAVTLIFWLSGVLIRRVLNKAPERPLK